MCIYRLRPALFFSWIIPTQGRQCYQNKDRLWQQSVTLVDQCHMFFVLTMLCCPHKVFSWFSEFKYLFFFLSFAFSCMLVQLFFKKHLCHSYQLWHNCLGRGPYLEVLSTCLLVCLVGWLVADGTLELVVNNWLVVDDWLVGWFDQL